MVVCPSLDKRSTSLEAWPQALSPATEFSVTACTSAALQDCTEVHLCARWLCTQLASLLVFLSPLAPFAAPVMVCWDEFQLASVVGCFALGHIWCMYFWIVFSLGLAGLFQVLPRSLRRLLEIACVSSDHNLMELSFVNSEISISGDCDLTKLCFLQPSPVQEVCVFNL